MTQTRADIGKYIKKRVRHGKLSVDGIVAYMDELAQDAQKEGIELQRRFEEVQKADEGILRSSPSLEPFFTTKMNIQITPH